MFQDFDDGDQVEGVRGDPIEPFGDKAFAIQGACVSIVAVGIEPEIPKQADEESAPRSEVQHGSVTWQQAGTAHCAQEQGARNAPLDRSGVGVEAEWAVAFFEPGDLGDLQGMAGIAQFIGRRIFSEYGMGEMSAKAFGVTEQAAR